MESSTHEEKDSDGASCIRPRRSDGAAETPTEVAGVNHVPATPLAPDPLSRYLSGALGLATTYWAFGVLGGFVWGVALSLFAEQPEWSDQQHPLAMAFIAYYVLNYIAIWNAADKYAGSRAWAYIAKALVLVGALVMVKALMVE